MTFGPSMDKSNIQGLVRETPWNGFFELNRLAFSEALPRNSESRVLAVAMRMIKKHYPHTEWVISFADGCQCGDGTSIARQASCSPASLNKSLLRLPDGSVTLKMTKVTGKNRAAHFARTGGSWSGQSTPLDGYQMRYIYFDPVARARLVPKEIGYSEIERRGAGMYRGIARGKQAMADPNRHSGAAAATAPLQRDRAISQQARGHRDQACGCSGNGCAPVKVQPWQ